MNYSLRNSSYTPLSQAFQRFANNNSSNTYNTSNPNYADGSYNSVGTTGGASTQMSGDPIIYGRSILLNRRSRLSSYSDPIRGDLSIQPINGQLFGNMVNVNPERDLGRGIASVISRPQNGSAALGAYVNSGSW